MADLGHVETLRWLTLFAHHVEIVIGLLGKIDIQF